MAVRFQVETRWVGEGQPCFVIAEAGVNHNGELELAKKLVDAAIEAGADAVKFQTFKAGNVVSRTAPKAEYQITPADPNTTQYEMLKRLEFSVEEESALKTYCRERGILFLSTPHDEESIEILDNLNVPMFKVGSGDVTNLTFLQRAARTGRPIILSTGMSTLGEVEEAVQTILAQGNHGLILMQCVSNYPADANDCNLKAMETLRTAFGLPVGFSDHTLGNEVALAAVALGACVIEKHLTVDKNLPGPDHRASTEPGEFRAMVQGIRRIEQALGDGVKRPAESERAVMEVARKSLVAAVDIPKGTVIARHMLVVKRPGTGITPRCIEQIIGREAALNILADQPIRWEALR